ncbi:mRNA-binding ribosome synthesis protein nop7, partial [Nowakowskiella sp. JEL0407]
PLGESSVYITRNQAIKKLQISLAQFRRLCILKGIYPREPKNKKKVNSGSTASRTFYFRKDIQYLLHEPILVKFREQAAHEKKINRAFGKNETVIAKKLMQNRPGYSLDHIIKERYPTFTDALRDLDDALSLVFLFASLPADQKKVHKSHTDTCKRLAAEFQRYVVYSKCLVKTFLSIKGIYYQVEIRGQQITWIVPYQFSQALPSDVDFKVMGTFLELYQTHLGFVNFKLYTDAGLSYPPKIDLKKDDGSAGLNCFILESNDGKAFMDSIAGAEDEKSDKDSKLSEDDRKKMESRIASLQSKLDSIKELDASKSSSSKQDDAKNGETVSFEAAKDVVEKEEDGSAKRINDVTTLDELVANQEQKTKQQTLFKNCVFWLSREVPRWSLEFVIRACGGVCGWDETSGAGSPIKEDSPTITHHIIDKPLTKNAKKNKLYERREFLQPQWVYDCINVGMLLSTDGYHEGETLPPHLSPFVSIEDGDYVPEEAYKLLKRQEDDFKDEVEEEDGETQQDDADEEEEVEEQVQPGKRKRGGDEETSKHAKKQVKEQVSRNKRKQPTEDSHQEELEAEAAGVPYSEYQQKTKSKKTGTEKAGKSEEEEMKDMAAMLLSKKKRKLYNSVVKWKNKKEEKAEVLRGKKEELKKYEAGSGNAKTLKKSK